MRSQRARRREQRAVAAFCTPSEWGARNATRYAAAGRPLLNPQVTVEQILESYRQKHLAGDPFALWKAYYECRFRERLLDSWMVEALDQIAGRLLYETIRAGRHVAGSHPPVHWTRTIARVFGFTPDPRGVTPHSPEAHFGQRRLTNGDMEDSTHGRTHLRERADQSISCC